MFLLFFVAWGGLTSQLFLHSLPYVPSLWQREGIFNHSTKRMTTSKSFRNGLEISTQSPTLTGKSRGLSVFLLHRDELGEACPGNNKIGLPDNQADRFVLGYHRYNSGRNSAEMR